MKTWKLYIDGKWVAAAETETVKSPYDGRPFCEAPVASSDQVESTLAAAVAAHAKLPPTWQRAEWLRSIASGIDRRRDDFVEAISEEAGKPIKVCQPEVDRAINTFELAASLTLTLEDEAFPLDVISTGESRECLVRRFPVGPVLGITPYNWPLNLGAHKMAPAIATGCPLIMRPSQQTPSCSYLLAQLAEEAGIWPGLYQVITCPPDRAEAMALDPRVRMITFTGSPRVGWGLKQKAYGKRVALELGGDAACILEPETDFDFAVPRLAVGSFAYAGQVCISVQRLFVHEEIADAFLDQFVRHITTEFRSGDPRDPETVNGPMITPTDLERVQSWLQEAVDSGATLLCGGEDLGNSVLSPAVIRDVPDDVKLGCEEVFGPVVTVETYSDFDQALDRVNRSRFGIHCGVFTNDIRKAFHAFERLEVGGVIINDYPTFRVDRMPYGGVKESGFGREGVKYTMEEMTEQRALAINRG